jgi:hypothetical protein
VRLLHNIDDFDCVDGNFKTLIVDSIFLNNERLLKLNITPDNQLPENVFWTFQGGTDMSVLFPILDTDTKKKLTQIDRDISNMTGCSVVEIKK